MIWEPINQGSNNEVTKMKSIYKNAINCCTGFILNSYGEMYCAS